jgi:hypothetical protein
MVDTSKLVLLPQSHPDNKASLFSLKTIVHTCGGVYLKRVGCLVVRKNHDLVDSATSTILGGGEITPVACTTI